VEADYPIHSEISCRKVVALGLNDKYKAGPNNGMHPFLVLWLACSISTAQMSDPSYSPEFPLLIL
jgi:hypothetical protein